MRKQFNSEKLKCTYRLSIGVTTDTYIFIFDCLEDGAGCGVFAYSSGNSILLLKCCFTSTETVGLLGMGAQDGHLDFHTPPELW